MEMGQGLDEEDVVEIWVLYKHRIAMPNNDGVNCHWTESGIQCWKLMIQYSHLCFHMYSVGTSSLIGCACREGNLQGEPENEYSKLHFGQYKRKFKC